MLTTGVKVGSPGIQSGATAIGAPKKSGEDGFSSVLESMFGPLSSNMLPIVTMPVFDQGKVSKDVLPVSAKQGHELTKPGILAKGLPLEVAHMQALQKDGKNQKEAKNDSEVQGVKADASKNLNQAFVHQTKDSAKQETLGLQSVSNPIFADNASVETKVKATIVIPDVKAPSISSSEVKNFANISPNTSPVNTASNFSIHSLKSLDHSKEQPAFQSILQGNRLLSSNEVPQMKYSSSEVKNSGISTMIAPRKSQSSQSPENTVASPSSITVSQFTGITHNQETNQSNLSPHTLDLNHATWPNDVARIVNHAMVQNDSSVQVKVRPEGMGDLLISVMHTSSGIQIQLESNQMATAQLLGQQTQQMTNAVNQLGITVAGVEVSFGQANLSNSGYGQQSKKSSSTNDSVRIKSEEVGPATSVVGMNTGHDVDHAFLSGSSVSFRA